MTDASIRLTWETQKHCRLCGGPEESEITEEVLGVDEGVDRLLEGDLVAVLDTFEIIHGGVVVTCQVIERTYTHPKLIRA